MLQILNSSNKCTGHIPLLGDLKQLVQLLLGGNSLSSTTKLNYHVFDSLTNCTLLREIHMNSNQLANELPPSVANLSVNLQHLFKDWKSIKTLWTYQLRKVFFQRQNTKLHWKTSETRKTYGYWQLVLWRNLGYLEQFYAVI